MNRRSLAKLFRHLYPDLGSVVVIGGEISEKARDTVVAALNGQSNQTPTLVLMINSPGGHVHCLLSILEALQNKRYELETPFLTTVGVGCCESAGADLLICGDYAVAEPGTTIMVHKGDATPDPLADPGTVERQIRNTLEVRAMAAAEMISLRLVRRAIICKARLDELSAKLGKATWQNIVTGKPVVDFFECLRKSTYPKLRAMMETALRRLCDAVQHSESLKVFVATGPESQRAFLEQLEPIPFRQVNKVVLAMCRQFVRYSFRFTAEEAYFLGMLDEVKKTSLPNLRDWIEQLDAEVCGSPKI